MQKRRFPAGFTLVELLVVITVIAILAALVLNTAGYVQRAAAEKRAKSEIEALSAALENYKATYGDYPTNSAAGSAGSTALFSALSVQDSTLNPSKKIFFEVSKSMAFNTNLMASGNYYVDPFGTAYEYRYPGDSKRSGTNFFDLWSYAGRTGTNTNDNTNNYVQWIKNW